MIYNLTDASDVFKCNHDCKNSDKKDHFTSNRWFSSRITTSSPIKVSRMSLLMGATHTSQFKLFGSLKINCTVRRWLNLLHIRRTNVKTLRERGLHVYGATHLLVQGGIFGKYSMGSKPCFGSTDLAFRLPPEIAAGRRGFPPANEILDLYIMR